MTMRPVIAAAVLAGCSPEPASTQEILQTVQELVDQGRAMAIEDAMVALTTVVDPDEDPDHARNAVADAVSAASACAIVTQEDVAVLEGVLEIDFGDDGCDLHGRTLVGSLGVAFTRPTEDTLIATLNFFELSHAGATLSGTTRVSWGIDATQRVISELRLDSAAADSDTPGRQIEIQSDRIQRTYKGMRQVDGWHRWQTLMGKWKAELGGWELRSGALLPTRGLTAVDTPFQHDVLVDHSLADDGVFEVRANGGRRDHVFTVAADGAITDLGDD